MVLENLVKGVKYVAGGLALGASMLFGGAVMSGCSMEQDEEFNELSRFTAEAGDREVHLSWRNPTTMDMPGVMIRRDVDEYPVDENDGALVYQGTDEAFTDTGLEHSVNYCYKAFSYSCADPMVIRTIREASAIPYDATSPGEITNLQTICKSNEIQLTWMNPTDADFVELLIVRNVYPPDGNEPVTIYQGAGQAVIDIGLVEDQMYSYGIYTFDDSGNRSPGHTFFRIIDAVTAIGWIGGGTPGWKTTDGATASDDDCSFNNPSDVTLDAAGNIYVADTDNNRICKYTSSGIFVGWLGGGVNGWNSGPGTTPGYDAYSFNHPVAVKVDSDGNIYVVDKDNNRIVKRDSDGNLVGWIGGTFNGWQNIPGGEATNHERGFNHPCGLCLYSDLVYVADTENNRISIWNSSDGTLAGFVKDPKFPSSGFVPKPREIYVWGLYKFVLGEDGFYYNLSISPGIFWKYDEFNSAAGASIMPGGSTFVSEGNKVAKRFSITGNFYYGLHYYGWIGNGSDHWDGGVDPPAGSDFQSFNQPKKIFVQPNGTLLIADSGNNRISKWQD